MTKYQISHKIDSHHLDRKAIIYLRQSSEKQVRQNIESQRLQYGLVNRAKMLGWHQVDVIDTDLGSSASVGACKREGFDRLIAMVAKGEVGIVFSIEASRLSRTDKDWCRLLEVCQIFGTLIGDGEQVYDLSLMDDQLILGIKGTLSVIELNVIRARLLAGSEEKARRGELMILLPPGYVKDGTGKAVKDPDQRIQGAIQMVFGKFRELWSIRQTFLYFHSSGIKLPVNKSVNGKLKIVWQLPTQSFIKDVLSNPFYAGAYVYGRRETEKVVKDGRVVKRIGGHLPPEECRVFIPDHHEAYVEWEVYKENQKLIANNNLRVGKDESVAPIRAGHGLLAGILRCGRCWHKLHVQYWGKSGTAARYLCKGDFDTGGKYCLSFGGSTVDRRFSQELLKVLSPLGLKACLEATKRLSVTNNHHRSAIKKQIKQLEYEVQRAFEQYNEVDPRNRLVAQELERRWNEKLEELEKIKISLFELEQVVFSLSAEERKKIYQMGENFKDIWESEHCTTETKKKIIRTIIEEVVVNLNDESQMLHFVIHWKGGSHTEFEMEKPPSGVGQKTSTSDLAIIRKMAVRYGDDEIARVLSKLGRRTGKGKRWNEQRVKSIRSRNKILGQKRTKPDPEILTLGGAAKYCQVSQGTIKRLISNDLLKKEQIVPWAPWEIKKSDLDVESVTKILNRLRETGKLGIKGEESEKQRNLFQ